jgi:hypothetical protein
MMYSVQHRLQIGFFNYFYTIPSSIVLQFKEHVDFSLSFFSIFLYLFFMYKIEPINQDISPNLIVFDIQVHFSGKTGFCRAASGILCVENVFTLQGMTQAETFLFSNDSSKSTSHLTSYSNGNALRSRPRIGVSSPGDPICKPSLGIVPLDSAPCAISVLGNTRD